MKMKKKNILNQLGNNFILASLQSKVTTQSHSFQQDCTKRVFFKLKINLLTKLRPILVKPSIQGLLKRFSKTNVFLDRVKLQLLSAKRRLLLKNRVSRYDVGKQSQQ